MKKLQFIALFRILAWTKSFASSYLIKDLPQTLIAEITMDTEQLLTKYNYPAETHYVTTEDSYILRLFRIPSPGSKIIFLEHGLMDSSDTWIIMGPTKALGYYFHDHGYDVWLGNARGNRYSRNHTYLDPDQNTSFWQFSWHEIGYYDLPASIDYILNNTGKENLTYVGHSQGTTAFLVMCSMRPEYNDKINLMHALAPVAFMKHPKCLSQPTCKAGMLFLKIPGIETINEMLRNDPGRFSFCFLSNTTLKTCLSTLYEISGRNPQQLNMTMLPIYFGHFPAGMALKQVLHYMQILKSNRFVQYDYGKLRNLGRYWQSEPPEYILSNIKAPVALYYSENDNLVNAADVKRLIKNLSNVVEENIVSDRNWSHVDYVWGNNARELLYKRMLEVQAKIENEV